MTPTAIRLTNAVCMLAQRLQRWPSLNFSIGPLFVSTGLIMTSGGHNNTGGAIDICHPVFYIMALGHH